MIPADTHIEGFIALDRERRVKRIRTALDYVALAAVVVLLLFGTGAVQILLDRPAPATVIIVDLTSCPEPDAESLPIITLTVTLSSDGSPETYRCVRWQKRPTARKPKQT